LTPDLERFAAAYLDGATELDAFCLELVGKQAMTWPEAFVWGVAMLCAAFLVWVWARAMSGRL
jgi:hypothetical protein